MTFNIPNTERQTYVESFLRQARANCLHEVVATAARAVPPADLRRELVACVPSEGLSFLQGTGIRDEDVYAVPCILVHCPRAIAFYRLLLGISQKQFYAAKTGLSSFKVLEERSVVPSRLIPLLGDFCRSVNQAISQLLLGFPRESLRADVAQLPIMTLGAQADGSWRTQIGSNATQAVFSSLKSIVRKAGAHFTETKTSISVRNSSGRQVTLMLSADPDVVIREEFAEGIVYKTAIEIKGGKDRSNVHNRAGEAEKSHQKARQDGAGDCWTIISLESGTLSKLKKESPSTREWFDLDEIRKQSGPGWNRIVLLTKAAMGI